MSSELPVEVSAEIPSESELLETLKESVKEVFDSMVITFTEAIHDRVARADAAPILTVETPCGSRVQATVAYESSVEFHGPLAGQVVLSFTAKGAADVAASLLMAGEDETLADEEVADALGECANLVTGVLKTKALDPVATFTVGVPTIVTPVPSNEREVRSGSLAYKLSQGLMSVEIWLD